MYFPFGFAREFKVIMSVHKAVSILVHATFDTVSQRIPKLASTLAEHSRIPYCVILYQRMEKLWLGLFLTLPHNLIFVSSRK